MQKIKIAVGQICSKAKVTKNLQVINSLVRQASEEDCKMIFLPESSDFMEQLYDEYKDASKEIQQMAQENNIWMSIGIHSLTYNITKYRNRQLIINNRGIVVDYYDKVHLFELLKEGDRFEAGDLLKVVDSPLGPIGLGICYDLRFPEFSWKLREMGANVLTYPSAFTVETGIHFEPLVVARAIETQCYVVAACQYGRHTEKRSTFGNSLIVDPYGKILAKGTKEPELLTAEIDLDYLNEVRYKMPVLNHKRRDLY
eukprot:NODE_41_length_29768_cov_0.533924.p11 type:complete len:256 gc:universal NODE_41_length_29768_cov_0.533924:25798-26565(+)